MTYKHVKFDDSAVMRSLEKLAKEKGLVESKPITKSASNKLNLSPTSNLMENILKLCAGLRQSGLEKYALDIENKFVALKQATHLYDATGEKGEDLVDAAHSEGSHKMEGLDNAVFQTILDKHVDMLNMIDKKPTGKLSNASDILKAVKIVLAQVPSAPPMSENPEQLQKDLNSKAQQVIRLVSSIESQVSSELTFSGPLEDISKLSSNLTKDNIKKIQSHLQAFERRLDPSSAWHYLSVGALGISEDTWDRIKVPLSKAKVLVNEMLVIRESMNRIQGEVNLQKSEPAAPAAPSAALQSNPSLDKINAVKKELDNILALVDADSDADEDDKKAIIDWVAKKAASLKKLRETYNTLSPETVDAALNKIRKGLDEARKQWE